MLQIEDEIPPRSDTVHVDSNGAALKKKYRQQLQLFIESTYIIEDQDQL